MPWLWLLLVFGANRCRVESNYAYISPNHQTPGRNSAMNAIPIWAEQIQRIYTREKFRLQLLGLIGRCFQHLPHPQVAPIEPLSQDFPVGDLWQSQGCDCLNYHVRICCTYVYIIFQKVTVYSISTHTYIYIIYLSYFIFYLYLRYILCYTSYIIFFKYIYRLL